MTADGAQVKKALTDKCHAASTSQAAVRSRCAPSSGRRSRAAATDGTATPLFCRVLAAKCRVVFSLTSGGPGASRHVRSRRDR